MDSTVVAYKRKKHFYFAAVTNSYYSTCLLFNDNPSANSPFRVIKVNGKKIILAIDSITQDGQIFLANKGFLKKEDTLNFNFFKNEYVSRVKKYFSNAFLLTNGRKGTIDFRFYICTQAHLYYFDNNLLISDINTYHTDNASLNFSFQISHDLYEDDGRLLKICTSDIQASSNGNYGYPFYFIDSKNYQLTTINNKGEEKHVNSNGN